MAIFFLPKSRMKKFLQRTDLPADMMAIDVSNKTTSEWRVLAPIFNHGDIPVPGMPGVCSRTIEGLWEGLKRFEQEGENLALLESDKPKKRRVTEATGKLLGYRYGDAVLTNEVEARQMIFIPAYVRMVENCPAARAKFDELLELSKTHTLHLYDGEENGDRRDARPYSYAALLAELLKGARKAKKAALV